MWAEPLRARVEILDTHNMRAEVYDGAGQLVADAPFVINTVARCGAFGEMNIRDASGAPRQRVRALVLLVRAALRFAASEGIQSVETRAPERLRAFAARLTGLQPEAEGPDTRIFRGNLAQIQTVTLAETDDDGEYRA